MARTSKWEEELVAILNEFEDEEEATIERVFRKVAKETRRLVQETSEAKFEGSGEYASGWKVEETGNIKRGRIGLTVCNPKNYQLTHLLERGHISMNQYGGPYKRVRGRRHIKPAEKWGNEELVRRLKKEL